MDIYNTIQNNKVKETFQDYIDALGLQDLDYYAFGIQDTITKTSASLMSRADWQDTFQKNNFAPHDPLRKAVFNTRRNVIFFQDLDTKDSLCKEIMLQRKKHSLNDGIILVERHLGYNFMLTICTGYSKFESYKYYMENGLALKRAFDDFKLIMTPISNHYLNATKTQEMSEKKIIHDCV
jgi:hypothetical protein